MKRSLQGIITMSTRALVTLFAIPLLALVACSREKSDWRSAQAADSPESYEQFIAAHPDSTLVTTAHERLQQLAEEKDWRAAAATDTSEAYQQFLVAASGRQMGQRGTGAHRQFRRRRRTSRVPRTTPAAPASGEGAVRSRCGANVSAPRTAAIGVQLGAFSSAERANDEWKKLKAEAAGLLDGLSPRVVVGESQGKTLYRLQAEVRDEAQARAICGGLNVAKKPCVPVIPHARP